jgi:hypothetical protein
MKIKAIGVRGIKELTENKVYEALYGIEEGIFPDRPFVTVINDYNREFSCHLCRFEIIDEDIKEGEENEIK